MAEVTETTRPHTTRSGHGWGYPPVGPKTTVTKIPKITISNPDEEEPLPTRWQETVEEQTKETENSDLDDEKKPTKTSCSGCSLVDPLPKTETTKIHIHRLDETSFIHMFQIAILFLFASLIIRVAFDRIVGVNETIIPF